MAATTNPSLCSSHPLHKARPTTRQYHIKLSFTNFSSLNDPSVCVPANCPVRPSALVARASSATESQPSKPEEGRGEGKEEEEEEVYEVELDKPYGLKFAKGPDGGTYIDAIAPGGSADKTKMFTVGDRVLETSAVFGTELWPAAEYGRTMYTIRQRIGPLFMRMQKRYGKMLDVGELTEKEIIRAERNSGVISNKLREIQMQNYLRKKEQKQCRETDLREGLKLYRSLVHREKVRHAACYQGNPVADLGNASSFFVAVTIRWAQQYEEALEKFESILGSKPELDESSIASYNVACCYSKLNQVQAGLSALDDAMQAGYEDFKRIRSDPDLANLRTSEEFETLLKKYDESFINENAINAIKSLFGFNKK